MNAGTKLAERAAMRMSQASASDMPAPAAAPLTAAITGFCSARTLAVISQPLFVSAPALMFCRVKPVDGTRFTLNTTSWDLESYRVRDRSARPRNRLKSTPPSNSFTRSGLMSGLPFVPEAYSPPTPFSVVP